MVLNEFNVDKILKKKKKRKMAMKIVGKKCLGKLTSGCHIVARSFVKQAKTIDTLTEPVSMSPDFFFRQFFDPKSSTYSYLLADIGCKEGIIIDPVIDWVERDVKIVQELSINLIYAINTHMHADHITGSGQLKSQLAGCKSMISRASGAQADVLLDPLDHVSFGRHKLIAHSTPGHTEGCMSFVCEEQGIAFTGDTLLIRGCGRTDFQGGSAAELYKSVHTVLFNLPGNFRIYPAHDYSGRMVSTVAEERAFNPRLTKSQDEFIKIMENLNLPYPKMIDEAVPANKLCGIYEVQVAKE